MYFRHWGALLVKAPSPIPSRLSPLPSPHRRPSSPPFSPPPHLAGTPIIIVPATFWFPAAVGFRFTRAHSALTLCRQSAYSPNPRNAVVSPLRVFSHAVPCEGPVRARLTDFSGERRRSVCAHSLNWNLRCSSPQPGSEMPIGSASTRSCPNTCGRAEIRAIDT